MDRKIEKKQVFAPNDVIAYAEGGIVSKEFIHSNAGSITFFAFDAGQRLSEHTSQQTLETICLTHYNKMNKEMKRLSIIVIAACAIALAACGGKNNAGAQTAANADTLQTLTAQEGMAVLVLLAHPDIAKSKANAALSKAAAEVEGVQVVNIYDHGVSPDTYRDLVSRAGAIVYEFPFYWMSSPHLLKQWTDEAFMAFVGEGLVKGKRLMVATTTGSEESAYQHGGRNKYTMDEYLRPFEGQANHAEMVWEKPLVVYGASTDDAEQRIADGCKEYKARLAKLVEEVKKNSSVKTTNNTNE